MTNEIVKDEVAMNRGIGMRILALRVLSSQAGID